MIIYLENVLHMIYSLLGPGHFKVYKTQYWMSCWSQQLAGEGIVHLEWNMYFPNLGHNICDGHAGHLKRYDCDIYFHSSCNSIPYLFTRAVKGAEADFEHMYNMTSIIKCMGRIKNTTTVGLSYEDISACDDPQNVSPVGEGFIKKYYHFVYIRPGVVSCKVKGHPESHSVSQNNYGFPNCK